MKERIAYDGWLKIFKREINGRTYDILKNYDAVAVFILNENNEILMVRQFRPALLRETLEIPAGVLDTEGESPEECAVREIEEETGIRLNSKELKKLVSYKPMMGFSDSTLHIFRAKVDVFREIVEEIKDDDVTGTEWISLQELREKIKQQEIFDGKTLMAYFSHQEDGSLR